MAFEKYDSDGDELQTRDQLKKTLAFIGIKLSTSELRDVLDQTAGGE